MRAPHREHSLDMYESYAVPVCGFSEPACTVSSEEALRTTCERTTAMGPRVTNWSDSCISSVHHRLVVNFDSYRLYTRHQSRALDPQESAKHTMKLVNKHVERDGSGYVTLRPEDDEDMWHVYNLISEGDEVRALAIRRVQTVSSTGSSDSFRVRVQLTLRVTKTTFSQAPSSSTGAAAGEKKESTAALQISGQVVNENDYVRLGAYHTLDLEGESACDLVWSGAWDGEESIGGAKEQQLKQPANRDFRLTKAAGWDSVALERIDESTKEGRGAELGAIVCGEGTAALCLLSEHMTTVRQRIETSVPRKRKGGTSGHDKVSLAPKGVGEGHALRYGAGGRELLSGGVPGTAALDTLSDAQGDHHRLPGLYARFSGCCTTTGGSVGLTVLAVRLHLPAGHIDK